MFDTSNPPPLFDIQIPEPGADITLLHDGQPFAVSKVARSMVLDNGRTTLLLENGLSVTDVVDKQRTLLINWPVRREGMLSGYINARPSFVGDGVLADAFSGRLDSEVATKPKAPKYRLADWGHQPGTSTLVVSCSAPLADLLIEGDDEQEGEASPTNLAAYMQRRFGPPNVGYDPQDMPYGAWVFTTPLEGLTIWAAPYRLLSLQIRAFVLEDTGRRLRTAQDAVMRGWRNGGDMVASQELADALAPYQRMIRAILIDLMRPVGLDENEIDPFGPVNGSRLKNKETYKRPPRLLPHDLSTMGLPPQLTRHGDLFREFCVLISQPGSGGTKKRLNRIVAELKAAKIGDPADQNDPS